MHMVYSAAAVLCKRGNDALADGFGRSPSWHVRGCAEGWVSSKVGLERSTEGFSCAALSGGALNPG